MEKFINFHTLVPFTRKSCLLYQVLILQPFNGGLRNRREQGRGQEGEDRRAGPRVGTGGRGGGRRLEGGAGGRVRGWGQEGVGRGRRLEGGDCRAETGGRG
jgi:hypothetical protein